MNTRSRMLPFIAVLVLSLAFASTSLALPLAARDTTLNPSDGFPVWYQDTNGLSLGQCFDSIAFCGLLPDASFDGQLPVVFPTNYPGEQFYFSATIVTGPPFNLLYVAATEGSFAGAGDPVDGQQAVFSRVRIRADITSAGTYTVTHPYGTQIFVVDTPGIRAINFSNDVFGLVAQSFDGPIDTNPASAPLVGPYLRPSSVSGGAPLPFVTDPVTGSKYISTPGVLSRVTGAPTGNNFVEISGPDGTETIELFDLTGKVVGLTASPTSLAFATQRAGITTSATVTITNPSLTSTATLSIGAVTGVNAADFTLGPDGCSGTEIATSGTCAVTVNFLEAAPGVNGTKSALLSFAVTTPLNTPPVTVNLSGTIDNVAPTVTASTPANNAINVPANNAITATFSEVVTNVTVTTFTVTTGGTTTVAGTVNFNAGSKTAVFTPAANLDPNGVAYTATLVGGPTGITDLVGNPLAQDFVINFTTALPDTTPPSVVSVAPANNALAVATSATVTIVLNEPVDPTTVNDTTIKLSTSEGAVAGTVTYDTQTFTVLFTPSADLAYNQQHTVTVTTGIMSLGGVPMAAEFTSTFVTNAAPTAPVLYSPADGATGVGTTVDLQWIMSTDSDNDTITYKLYYCTNKFMVGCDPVTVAKNAAPRAYFAGLGGYGAGILLAGLFVAGGVKSRKKLFLLLAALVVSGMAVTSCGGGSDSPPPPAVDPATLVTKNVTGLAAATPYYWKVIADDGNGGLASSETHSFTTM